MAKHSAGIFLYRKAGNGYEVLLVHPGGPFWAKKDAGAWSMPKGEFDEGEDPFHAAKREFEEEVGTAAPEGEYADLGEAKQKSGKIVHAFALESDFNLDHFKSNTFEMEWPPKSGRQQTFNENDKAAWTVLNEAKQKLVSGQVPLLEALAAQLEQTLDAPDNETPQTSLF